MLIQIDTMNSDMTWRRFDSKEEWEAYRKELYELRPRMQPWRTPSSYPCLYFREGEMDNSNGPDYEIGFFIHEWTEVPDPEG